MPESTLPEGTANDALSFDDGVDAIADALGDSETTLQEEDQAQTTATGTEDEAQQGDVEGTAAEETHEDAEGTEGPESYAKGKFAADDAKVTLSDGSTLSIQELKRGYISRQYLTRETQALSESKKAFETQHEQVSEYARNLTAQRDLILQAAQYFMPQRPDRAMIGQDVIGYNEAVADYEERMGILNQLFQHTNAEQARIAQEQEAAQQEHVAREANRLTETMPELKDAGKYREFWNEAVNVMGEYGFSPAELDGAIDHRFYKVYRDLMKYHRALKRAPQVKQDMQNKPRLMPGGNRMDPKAKNSREQQVRSERAKQTGRITDVAASLMDLDL